jgi:HPt (histidine-containing phosphotransfer) domain-containing protein
MKAALDEQRLLALLKGSQKRLVRLSGVFFQYYQQQLDAIEAALPAGGEALRAAAHTYKGTVSSFAAEPSVELCLQLEQGTPKAGEVLDQLRQQAEQIRQRLGELPQEEGWN